MRMRPHHLGFLFNMDEYKVMGRAPYGDPATYAAAFRRLGAGPGRHPRADATLPSLLAAIGARTGMSVVLNTPFNLRCQPIVRTPHDAVATFCRSGMNALAVGDRLVLTPARSGPATSA